MPTTIFFSWQTDTPTKEGRNLIERALGGAISRIGEDVSVEEAARELEIDRDTKGVPGSPPIVDTIFKKIDSAALFIADLTTVAKRPDGRPTPNPNVLIEYGWALKSLTHTRIVGVINTAFGKPTPAELPFDLGHLRYPLTYHCPSSAGDDERKAARAALAKDLEAALRTFLDSDDYKAMLPRPAQFQPRQAIAGSGKFRALREPLGQDNDSFDARRSTGVLLKDGRAIWLRLMPRLDPSRTWRLTELEAAANPQRGGKPLMPLSQRGRDFSFVRAEDGFGWYGMLPNQSGLTHSTSFAFTTGEVWGIDTLLLSLGDGKVVPDVVDMFAIALKAYTDFLSRIGVSGPYRWIAGMENLKGRGLAIHPPPPELGVLRFPIDGSCVAEVVVEEGGHRIGDQPQASLRPFFAKLYDTCGIPLPEWI